MPRTRQEPIAARVVRLRLALEAGVFAVAIVLTAWSAVIVKEANSPTPLLSIDHVRTPAHVSTSAPARTPVDAPAVSLVAQGPVQPAADAPGATRWFNGRPVRPARTIWMKVTAYSPDHRSCGIFADGKTSTLHSVWTNGMNLVAADTRILPFGSMITVPGYGGGDIVPVLDRGGKIKGHRLDVLYSTHAEARRWGVRNVPVVVWEYADGKPAPNPRKERQ
jgi:3D (Asp-Asp-Asp) domain-containing protein